jgi:hypothetical protein
MVERRLYEWAIRAKKRDQGYIRVDPQEIISLVEVLKGDYKSYQEVAKMLADELKMIYCLDLCKPETTSSALIAYKVLVGEK